MARIVSWLRLDAVSLAVLPRLSFWCSSAPAVRSTRTTSSWPRLHANMRAVLPCAVCGHPIDAAEAGSKVCLLDLSYGQTRRFLMRLRAERTGWYQYTQCDETNNSPKHPNAVRVDARLAYLAVDIRLMMDEGLDYRCMPSLQNQPEQPIKRTLVACNCVRRVTEVSKFEVSSSTPTYFTKMLPGRVCITAFRKDGPAKYTAIEVSTLHSGSQLI